MKAYITSWYVRYMDLAQHVATWSRDKSTKVGCVIVDGNMKTVVAMGHNSFPRGTDQDAPGRSDRPLKYKWTEHAERNAIYDAARRGVPLEGCIMFLTLFPCTDCARAIIQTGIKELNCLPPDMSSPQWGEDFKVSHLMLIEAGIEIRYLQ